MLSELKEFLSSLLPISRWGQRIKELFSRNRISVEVKAFASYLYAQGLSLRKLRNFLRDLGVRVSYVAIWKWVQRIGENLRDKLFSKLERRALVVGETKIRMQKGQIWIIVAIDPENREIVGLHISEHREMIDIP